MAETTVTRDTNNTAKAVSYDVNHSYHLNNSDSPGMTLVNIVFDGRGYLGWRRSILLSLSAKKNIGFINEACQSPDHEQWSCVNNMVISWILNALSKDIADSVIYSKTAKELWDSLEQRFGRSNGAKLLHMLTEFDVSHLARVSSPLDPASKLQANDIQPSQYMQKPCVSHFTAALRVPKHLSSNPGQGILLSVEPSFSLLAFCDADWAYG